MPINKVSGKKYGLQKYRVRVNYQDDMGNYKQIERTAYGIDHAKMLELQLSLDVKEQPSVMKQTLNQLYHEYIAVKKYEVRETSLDKMQSILHQHILPHLGTVQLQKLSLTHLQNWKTCMEQHELSLKTKQHIFSEFRTMLNYAVKMQYLSSNPLTRLGNFKNPTEQPKQMDFYTADEFQRYIAAAKHCALKALQSNDIKEFNYYVFFCIAFYTGLRKGEIHGLQWNDIEDGYLSVNRSISQKLKGKDRETPPKNKTSIRTLQLPLPLIQILDEHKQRYKAIEDFSEHFKICGGIRALRDTSIQNRNQKYATLADLHTIRIHDFRHSHVSLLANEGINIQEIARRLGHAKIEMTWNTYSHLYPREEEKAVQVLNRIQG